MLEVDGLTGAGYGERGPVLVELLILNGPLGTYFPTAFVYAEQPAPGPHTYTIQVNAISGTVGVRNRIIFCLGMKR